ncbi:hypothetical protein HAX54_022357 [Datura stramonium]|uniref:Uncharacterized protein n=1 Tax=Datura stramonium TaxID=4076 RepID=A0ABS8S499_DATST|nr:hypothetical protein [Datura stramonium]
MPVQQETRGHRSFSAMQCATQHEFGAVPYARLRPSSMMPCVAHQLCPGANKVGPGFKDPLDDDVATEHKMARVDLNIEFSDDKEEDFEMGEAAVTPKDEKE